MRISPGLLDLVCVSLLLYMTAAGITARNPPPEGETPEVSLPRGEEPAADVGGAGSSGEVRITARREGQSTALFLDGERVASITELEERLVERLPPRAIIRAEEDLPVSIAVDLFLVAQRTGVPASLAYDPRSSRKEGVGE